MYYSNEHESSHEHESELILSVTESTLVESTSLDVVVLPHDANDNATNAAKRKIIFFIFFLIL